MVECTENEPSSVGHHQETRLDASPSNTDAGRGMASTSAQARLFESMAPYIVVRDVLLDSGERCEVAICATCRRAIGADALAAHAAEPAHRADSAYRPWLAVPLSQIEGRRPRLLRRAATARLGRLDKPLPVLPVSHGFTCSECAYSGTSFESVRRHVRRSHHDIILASVLSCRVQRLSTSTYFAWFAVGAVSPGERCPEPLFFLHFGTLAPPSPCPDAELTVPSSLTQ